MSHQTISFIKSFIRIIGYIGLMFNLNIGIFILIVSELLGFYEEVGE